MQDISVIYLFRLAWKRLWALLLAFFVFAASVFAYCKLVAVPIYSAEAKILVTNGAIVTEYEDSEDAQKNKFVSGTDISASRSMLSTVVGILNAPDMYKFMADKLGGTYDFQKLMRMGKSARDEEGTLFVFVTFKSTSGTEAQTLANKYAELACEYVPEQIPQSVVKVCAQAISYQKVYPQTVTTSLIAGLVGLVLAFVAVFLIDISNQSIRGEEEFMEKYEIPLLGSVPDFENAMSGTTNNHYSKGGYYGAGK